METIGNDKCEDKGFNFWMFILNAAMKIPFVNIDRKDYLKKELLHYYSDAAEVDAIIEKGVIESDVPIKILDAIANSAINYHTTLVTGLSFAAGLPGGSALIGAIPADLAQFYAHVLAVAQKVSFVYGWGDSYVDEMTDEFRYQMTLFIGLMSGAKGAETAVNAMAKVLASQVEKRLPKIALMKYAFYNVAKQVAKWLGLSLTKNSFAKVVSKIVPFVGGVISGGITLVTFRPMARRLQKALKNTDLVKLPVQKGQES